MFIQAFPSGPFSTNAYVVACANTKQAAIIDPAPDSTSSVISYLKQHQLTVDKILLTHSHWDHIADISLLKKIYPLKVYVHPLDRQNLEQPGSDGIPHWIPIEGVVPDELLENDRTIEIGQLKFQIIHTPGHSPGGICFYHAPSHTLFSGDTLFKGSIGNISFSTSQPSLMWTSLDKLSKLPSQTKVYPGHGPQTTIGTEFWLPKAQQLFGS